MTRWVPIIGALATIACSSKGPEIPRDAAAIAGTAGAAGTEVAASAGAAGAGTAGAGTAGAGTAGAGAAGAGAGAGGAGAGVACVPRGEPENAPYLNVEFPGDTGSYYAPSEPQTLASDVYVERVSARELHLVDDTGRRVVITANARDLALEGLLPGTRLWLSAYSAVSYSNPYFRRESMRFSLRAEENGPVLLAAMYGTADDGDTLVPVPLEVVSRRLCTEESGNISSSSGEACSRSIEIYGVAIGTDRQTVVEPGGAAEVRIDGALYELGLWQAEYERYSPGCAPADWEPGLDLRLDVVARAPMDLVTGVPIVADALPACLLGPDNPPFVLDPEALDWEAVSEGELETEVSPTSPGDGTVVFSVATGGTLLASGLSAEARTVLERVRWLSMVDGGFVLRDSEGGEVLGVHSYDGASTLARAEVFATAVAFERRCEWMSEACRNGDAIEPLSLYDVTLGTEPAQRLPTHERFLVELGARTFDAWAAVTPSCVDQPPLQVVLLVAD